ncbi:MAG: hypothetical protein QOE59_2252, partial [Actinomycetota bacterium]|nr:hypothetical protein [Actinomycetota bacterium]
RKLPDMARGLGQSMRILKAETRGLQEDDLELASYKTAEPVPGAPPTDTGSSTPSTPDRPSGTARPDAAADRPSSAERDAS